MGNLQQKEACLDPSSRNWEFQQHGARIWVAFDRYFLAITKKASPDELGITVVTDISL